LLATVSKDGVTKLWQGDQLLKEILPKSHSLESEGRAVTLALETKELLVGYSNGNINCFDFKGLERWEILDCHKGGISTLFMVQILLDNLEYIIHHFLRL
jgi:hypothetical protein